MKTAILPAVALLLLTAGAAASGPSPKPTPVDRAKLDARVTHCFNTEAHPLRQTW